MKERITHWLILFIGWTFLILGLAGFFLPFLQGFLFTFIGLGILSSRSRWAHRIMARLRARYPRQYQAIRRKTLVSSGNMARTPTRKSPKVVSRRRSSRAAASG